MAETAGVRVGAVGRRRRGHEGKREKSGARVEGSCAAHRCAVGGFRPATARLGRARVYSYAPTPDGLTLRARGCAAFLSDDVTRPRFTPIVGPPWLVVKALLAHGKMWPGVKETWRQDNCQIRSIYTVEIHLGQLSM